jgi:hypothetical protein
MCLAPGTKTGLSSVALDGTDAPLRKAAQMVAAKISRFMMTTEATAACRPTQLFRSLYFHNVEPTAKSKRRDWLTTGGRIPLPMELPPSGQNADEVFHSFRLGVKERRKCRRPLTSPSGQFRKSNRLGLPERRVLASLTRAERDSAEAKLRIDP